MATFPARPVILQIIPELGPGGAEQGCIDVAEAIAAAGGQAIVVSNGGPRVHELSRLGAQHISLPVHSKNPLVMWQNVRKLKALIRDHGVNIVHARSRAPAWSAARAVQGTPARFMTTCHAPYNISGEGKRLYNSSIVAGERVIAISEYVAAYMRENYRIGDSKIRVIHRGIPLEKFHPTMVTPQRMIALSQAWRIPEECNVVMLPGRLTRWKGHHVLIDALARLNRRDIFGIIIGSDQGRTEYRKELEDAIQEKGLAGRVRMVDHCPDMPAAYMLASVVVSASVEPEGFGRIPVEGQAMGRPVIATDHGGAKETVLPGQTGWLVLPGDAPALAKTIEDVLALNVNQRVLLATRAMNHVAQNFTRHIMMDKTLDVYAELLR
ncbi:MAG: glycosyltransferase family 4 protein [Alphaproteobacteria bacterium]|nr:glycosyltransferase family 4 protein [Alphaproteobacteria bacterium]